MDVVPAGDGWDTDPYEPVIRMERSLHADQAMTKVQVWQLTMR